MEKSSDHIFQQLVAQLSDAPDPAARTFLLDGSSVRAAHSQQLCDAYPPGSNQHGESHWPLIRVLQPSARTRSCCALRRCERNAWRENR